MKRSLVTILGIILVIALIITGCGTGPAPSAPVSPAPTSAPTASAKPASSTAPSVAPTAPAAKTAAAPSVIRLKYSDQNPQSSWASTKAAAPSLKMIEDATNGRVKIDGYWSQTLCKASDNWEATKNGVADMAWMYHGYWPNLTPLADVFALPFLPFKSAEQASGIMWKTYEKYPSIQKQFKDNKIIGVWCSQVFFLVTTKKQVKTIEDLKGLKIRSIGGPATDMFKLVNAVPVTMGMPDTYLNMEKGVIDGMGTLWEALLTFRQYEVAKYYTYYPLYVSYFTQAMNLDKWNSLSPDVQKQIEGIGGLKWAQTYGKNMFDESAKTGAETAKKQGYPMIEYTPTQAEIDQWVNLAGKPLWAEWVKKMNAMGYTDAQDILNYILDQAKTYNP